MHNCNNLRATKTFRVSSSNYAGYKFRVPNHWDVYADGVSNVTAAVEAFNNGGNKSIAETTTITTRAMSKWPEACVKWMNKHWKCVFAE